MKAFKNVFCEQLQKRKLSRKYFQDKYSNDNDMSAHFSDVLANQILIHFMYA